MLIHCELLILILGLTLADRVHAAEIIGGHEAVPHSRPYMVLVVMKMEDGRTKHCGGFLLQKDFVMTAAHCKATSYTVLLGFHKYQTQVQIQQLAVQKDYPHDDFILPGFKHDIMLLKLSSEANFSKNVEPIALADISDVAQPKSCLVSGWGTTDNNTYHMSRILMEVNVTLTDSQRCVEDNVYCCEGEMGPSFGDSGGPLICEGKAYGVTSVRFSQQKSSLYYFTKIPAYRSWISSIMDEV